MKRLTVFETSILGLFAGIVVSTYTSFVINSDAYVGKTLELITLRPLFDQIVKTMPVSTSDTMLLIMAFLFIVLVFTVYGAVVGLIIKLIKKPKYVVVGLVVILLGVSVEQTLGHMRSKGTSQNDNFIASVTQPFTTKKTVAQKNYFGMEAWGDLGGDEQEDVAFIIHRSDAERGMLYYLTSAITTDTGKEGTNLVFLGDKVAPEKISIKDKTVYIGLTPDSDSESKTFTAKITDNVLVKITETKITEEPQADSEVLPSL